MLIIARYTTLNKQGEFYRVCEYFITCNDPVHFSQTLLIAVFFFHGLPLIVGVLDLSKKNTSAENETTQRKVSGWVLQLLFTKLCAWLFIFILPKLKKSLVPKMVTFWPSNIDELFIPENIYFISESLIHLYPIWLFCVNKFYSSYILCVLCII